MLPAIMRESEGGIEFNRTLEMRDGRVAILTLERAEDETTEEVAPAQVFFVSFRVLCRAARHINLLIRAQLNPQAIDDALRDGILNGDDVFGFGIYAVAPENVRGGDV